MTTNIANLPNAQSFGWADSAFSRSAAGVANIPSVVTPLGTVSAAFLRPTGGAAGTGFYWVNTTNLGLAISGTERFRFGSGGVISVSDGVSFGNTIASPYGSIRANGSGVVLLNGSAVSTVGAVLEMIEIAAPAAPATNRLRFYAEDNGSGKTKLMVLFPTGAAAQIAIEP